MTRTLALAMRETTQRSGSTRHARGGGEGLARPLSAAAPSKPTAPAPPPASGDRPAPRRLICYGADAVLADAAAGAELLSFSRATALKLLQVHGRRPHVGLLHRAADPAKPRPLESVIVNGVKCTSEPAVRRWIAANSQGRANTQQPTPTPHQEERRRRAVESRLDALGIG